MIVVRGEVVRNSRYPIRYGVQRGLWKYPGCTPVWAQIKLANVLKGVKPGLVSKLHYLTPTPAFPR